MHIYYVCDGQDDNIGDIVLRRRLLEQLQALGEVNLCVNDASDGFLESLGVRPADRTFRSFKQFVVSLLGACLKRDKVLYVYNPGELQVTFKESMIGALLVPILWVVRHQGGGVVRAGSGLREWHRLWGPVMRATARVADITYWRDTETARRFRGSSAPDWAFDLRTLDLSALPDAGVRHRMAVSLRCDRPEPSATWCAALLAAAQQLGVVPLVVSQVRRDDDSSTRLAARLGCEVLTFSTRTPAEQERLVRTAYSESVAVVSDRLHALALGCIAGALPAGVFESSDVKVGRHFETAHLPNVSADVRGWTHDRIRDFIVERATDREAVERGLAVARADLRRIGAEISALVHRSAESSEAKAAVRVLLSLGAPDGTTRFVDQITAELPVDIEPMFFSWRTALIGRYDVFHVHWPDALMRTKGRMGAITHGLYGLLLLRLFVTRTPLVRTLHNMKPHEDASPYESRLLHWTDELTTDYIRLNTTTTFPASDRADTATILHGHYRDRFAELERNDVRARTLLFFGLIRPYKGLDALLDSFGTLGEEWQLRIVGAALDAGLAQRINDTCDTNDRVSARLRFVSDEELVREISAAEVVVLPYTELHNSGATLVALSLDRPVIVPDTPTTEALSVEVGDAWVVRLASSLTGEALDEALVTMNARRVGRTTPPALAARDWQTVGRQHGELYRRAVGRRRGPMRRRRGLTGVVIRNG